MTSHDPSVGHSALVRAKRMPASRKLEWLAAALDFARTEKHRRSPGEESAVMDARIASAGPRGLFSAAHDSLTGFRNGP